MTRISIPWKYMRKYSICKERLDLYRDFVCDLVYEVHKTFLGGDIMGEKENKEHFDWCWNKVIENFRKSGIYFDEECELKNYLWNSFYEMFYNNEGSMDELKDNLMIMWNFIFDDGRMDKTEGEMKYTINAYIKFDNCLKDN